MFFRFAQFIAAAALLTSGCGSQNTSSVVPGGLAVQTFGAQFSSTNLIADGSFENPLVPAGGYAVFSTGQSFGHWNVVGAAGNVAIVSGTFAQNGFSFPAGCGKQWLDLTGTSNSATGVSQTLKTTIGNHLLTLAVGNVYNPGGIFGTTSTVNVLVNGAQVFSATNSKGKGVTRQVWQRFTTTVAATSGSTTISFINGDPSSDTNNGLDCVNLQ